MFIPFDSYYPKQFTITTQADFKIYFWTHF